MKLNKTLLTTAILASSLVLTACNEKKAETKAPEKAKTEQVVKQDTTKVATKTTNKIDPTTQALYAASFKVTPTNISLGETENKIPFIQYNYIIENISNTPIVAAQWATPVIFNKKVIDVDLFQTEFKDGLAPKAKKTAFFRRALNVYPQDILEELKKGSKLNLFTIAGTIIFADGSSVSINTPETLTKSVIEQQKILNKQLEERNKAKTKTKKVVKETPAKTEVKEAETKQEETKAKK